MPKGNKSNTNRAANKYKPAKEDANFNRGTGDVIGQGYNITLT